MGGIFVFLVLFLVRRANKHLGLFFLGASSPPDTVPLETPYALQRQAGRMLSQLTNICGAPDRGGTLLPFSHLRASTPPPTADHVIRLSSGGGGRVTSPLSETLAGAQCSGEGWALGGAATHSVRSLLFFRPVSLEAKQNAGVYSLSPFQMGCLRRPTSKSGAETSVTPDSSFPPVELVAAPLSDGSL